MTRFPFLRFAGAAALLLLTAASGRCDTVILNTGEELRGDVTSDTPKEVVMNVKIGSGIMDQRVIPRAEVKSVSRTTPEDIAYAEIKGFAIGANSLPKAAYEKMLLTLNTFLRQFPASARAAEVRGKIEAFTDEERRVEAGGFKWNNRWMTADEAAQERVQLNGEMLLASMGELAKRGDLVGALNAFDRMEKTAAGCRSYPDAVVLAQQLIPRLDADIDRAVALARTQEAQWKTGVDLMREPERSQTIAARNAQIARGEASLVAADKAGVMWKPLLPMIDASAQALKQVIQSETQRLSQLQLGPMRKSIAATENAARLLAAEDAAGASNAVREAQTLWSSNEAIPRLTTAIQALTARLAATPTPTPIPSPTPAPAGSPTPAPRIKK